MIIEQIMPSKPSKVFHLIDIDRLGSCYGYDII